MAPGRHYPAVRRDNTARFLVGSAPRGFSRTHPPSSSIRRGRHSRAPTTSSVPTCRRSIRRCSSATGRTRGSGPSPGGGRPAVPFSAALLILWAPGGFRFTCYYYRGAYYKAFWQDPPACTVGEPRKSYWGERSFPLIIQNVHRYFLYLALLLHRRPDVRRDHGVPVRRRARHRRWQPGADGQHHPAGQLHVRLPLAAPPRRRPQGRDLDQRRCSWRCYNCVSAMNRQASALCLVQPVRSASPTSTSGSARWASGRTSGSCDAPSKRTTTTSWSSAPAAPDCARPSRRRRPASRSA